MIGVSIYLHLLRDEAHFWLVGDRKKKCESNYMKYVEVVEEFISIQKPPSNAVPMALSIEEYSSKFEGLVMNCLLIFH